MRSILELPCSGDQTVSADRAATQWAAVNTTCGAITVPEQNAAPASLNSTTVTFVVSSVPPMISARWRSFASATAPLPHPFAAAMKSAPHKALHGNLFAVLKAIAEFVAHRSPCCKGAIAERHSNLANVTLF